MLKLKHNMGADGCITLTKFGAPGHVTANLEAENDEKVDRFEPVYLRKYRY